MWYFALVLALALPISAFRRRVAELGNEIEIGTNSDADLKVQVLELHAEGLYLEHDLSARWIAPEEDKPIIAEIYKLLNPVGADVPWTWTNDEDKDWDFKALQVLETNAWGSLALHMLHRHGLGPLLASRDVAFTRSVSGLDPSQSNLQTLVDKIEQCELVKHLGHLLVSLTLPGLRSLHSYDHEWSKSHRNVLQAGHSAHTFSFMSGIGFTKARCEEAIAAMYTIHKKIFSYGHEVIDRISKINSTFIHKYASSLHTGQVTSEMVEISEDGSGHAYLMGTVNWEDGPATHVKFKLDKGDAAHFKAYADSDLQRALVVLTTEYIDDQLRPHKAELQKTRLVWWTGEECEFAGMYSELQKPAYVPKFDAMGNPINPSKKQRLQ